MRRTLPAAVPMLLLAGCGRENSIWSGLSGVVLFILIVWACVHFIRK